MVQFPSDLLHCVLFLDAVRSLDIVLVNTDIVGMLDIVCFVWKTTTKNETVVGFILNSHVL